MAVIRPLERDDLPRVADLVRSNLVGWQRDANVLARNLVDHPWASDPLRSLVAVDDAGALIGSVGAQSRRLRFGDRKLEAICVSHLVVATDRRAGAAGALLVRELLSGDQDLTWTDSGTDGVVRIWRMLGGDLDHTRTCDWMIVLRPGRWLRGLSGGAVRRAFGRATSTGGWAGPHLAPVRGIPVPSRKGGRDERDSASGGEAIAEEVSVAELAEALPELDKEIRLRVDYDADYLEYVFSYLEMLGLKDEIVRKLVRRNGRAIGWYAYLARPVASRVIHVGASAREVEQVTSTLIEDARRRGIEVLSGRLEPHLDAAVRGRAALLSLNQQPLVHSRDPEILAAVSSSSSLLTEMDLIDSEWW